jgi:hypothetical protein
VFILGFGLNQQQQWPQDRSGQNMGGSGERLHHGGG